jgi:hypothetical protein
MRGILILILLIPHWSWAQEKPTTTGVLHLLHREKRTEKYLESGIKVTVRFTDYSRMKGFLEGAKGDSILVSGTYFSAYDINFIGHRNFWSKAGGIALLGSGLGLVVYAIVDAGNGNLPTSVLYGGMGTGVGIMGVGLLRDGKRYYLDGDWKVIP